MSKLYEIVANKIIERMEQGDIPWVKNWDSNNCARNHKTGKPYRGINKLLLPPGEYGTFKQINECGGSCKGVKSHMIVFWNFINKKDEDGEEISVPMLKYYNVFNVLDCGLELKHILGKKDNDVIEHAEEIISEYSNRENLKINIVDGSDEAFYVPSLDYINMPHISQFTDSESYYATLNHECIHSTMHKSRLNRKFEEFDTKKKQYAIEELVAEIGACMLNSEIGIENEKLIDNSAAYCQSWIAALKNDNKLILAAAGKAQKAVDYILNVKFENED